MRTKRFAAVPIYNSHRNKRGERQYFAKHCPKRRPGHSIAARSVFHLLHWVWGMAQRRCVCFRRTPAGARGPRWGAQPWVHTVVRHGWNVFAFYFLQSYLVCGKNYSWFILRWCKYNINIWNNISNADNGFKKRNIHVENCSIYCCTTTTTNQT